MTETGIATVYAEGKIERVDPGTRAGDFLPNGQEADLVLKDGSGLTFVDSDYRLKAGDSLVVTPRGVAG